MSKNIIGVKYESKYQNGVFDGKLYSYYTDLDVKIGDIVEAPTMNSMQIARVSRVNIPEDEIASFKDKLKTITRKIDREIYLKFAEIQEVA